MSLPRSITIGGREIPVPVTLGDRLAYWRNPEAGLARWQARRLTVTQAARIASTGTMQVVLHLPSLRRSAEQ